MALVGLDKLCPPAAAYLAISAIALIVMFWQNRNNNRVYCLGVYQCDVASTPLLFVVKAVYMLFWTWILNLLCKNGYMYVAWVLFIIPFLLLFLSIAWMMADYTLFA